MIEEQLKEFGLSNKETKVYLALLELGSAPVQEIAKFSGINRSTTYVTLASLLTQGLINIAEKSNTSIYIPISPELLIQKATELINKYSKIEEDIESIMPNLQSLSKNLKRRPRVLFFEGIEGIKNVHESVFACGKGTIIRTFSQPSLWENLQPSYYARISKKMSNHGLIIKAIQPTDSKKLVQKNPEAEVLYISGDNYAFTSDLSIYGNKVILISPRNKYGVMVENEDMAYTMKELFDLAWEEAKRISVTSSPKVACQEL